METHAKPLDISSRYKTEQYFQLIYADEDIRDD